MPLPAHAPSPTTQTLRLVPAKAQCRKPHAPLALWHLLSLDAPTVAALWTVFAAHCSGVLLPWRSAAAMFLAVWMLYAADRLLDARLLEANAAAPDLEERHRFHYRHKGLFLAGILGASVTLAVLLRHIDPASLRLYVLLGCLLFAYFFLIHIHRSPAHRLPKELAVGLFFPAAIFIPTVARAPELRLALAPGAVLFAAVCTLNCLYLYAWEHPGSRESAHWTTRFATRHLRALSILAALTACLVAAFQIYAGQPKALVLLALASGFSATLLLFLHAQRHRFSPVRLRAAADLALLTPLLLFPFLR